MAWSIQSVATGQLRGTSVASDRRLQAVHGTRIEVLMRRPRLISVSALLLLGSLSAACDSGWLLAGLSRA